MSNNETTPIVLDDSTPTTSKLPKLPRLNKRSMIMVGVAVAAIAAGTLALVLNADNDEDNESNVVEVEFPQNDETVAVEA